MIILKIIMILSLALMIYVNYTANSKPLGGVSTGEMSARYSTMFTPAGFTFSIWGIIYIFVFIFVGDFLLMKNSLILSGNYELIGYLFVISCFLNALWLYAWHYDRIIWSSIVMTLLLSTLLVNLTLVSPNSIGYYTFSLYAGWVSVAFILNISILILKYKIPIFMKYESIFFYIILLVSVLIGLFMLLFRVNYVYGLVFLWAYYGVYKKQKENKRAI